MSVETITLGCRLNFAESETIARSAPLDEDWVIVNSCAVTNEAVRQTRQAIRHAHRQRPNAPRSSSPAAPPSSTAVHSRTCPKSTAWLGQSRDKLRTVPALGTRQ